MTPKEELQDIRQQIEALEERKRAIYQASLNAPTAEKVCDDIFAEMMAETPHRPFPYPLQVHGVTSGETAVFCRESYRRDKIGSWVAIRPCGEEYGGKTFLGVYIGEVATGIGWALHEETGILEAKAGFYNPAIWVPDLARVILGAESWWGILKSPEDMKQITKQDIENIWYVQAMRALTGGGS